MKITKVKLSEFPDHDHGDHHDQEVVEKEAMEEGQSCQLAVVSVESPKSMVEKNLGLAQLSNSPRTPSPSTPSPSTMLKRKKAKDVKDGVSLAKKKKLSSPKSNNVVPDHARKSASSKRVKAAKGLNSPPEVKSQAMIRAEEVQSNLSTEFPSFVKAMVYSHVASCFWMGLPYPFSRSHLPKKDCLVILEDEGGEKCEVKYIADRWALSGGWRAFALGHKLVERDVLVFHLVEATKFKVYITRASDSPATDGSLSLVNLEAQTKQSNADDAEKVTIAFTNKKKKFPKSPPLAVVLKKNKMKKKKGAVSSSEPNLVIPLGQTDIQKSSKFPDGALRFKDIKTFEDFKILNNEVCIDSELPKHTRIKYYQLCRSQNAFLHSRLLKGLNCILVAGVIFEIVDISDSIRACKLTTSPNKLTIWEKTLKSFELLGMNVGFLLARLHRLRELAFESEGASETRRYIEAKTERVRAEDEIRNLETKLVELKEESGKFDVDIETLKSKVESYELKFQEEVEAPW